MISSSLVIGQMNIRYTINLATDGKTTIPDERYTEVLNLYQVSNWSMCMCCEETA